MTISDLTASDSKKILRKACKVLSNVCGLEIKLHCNSIGEIVMLWANRDCIVVLEMSTASANEIVFTHRAIFSSASQLLESMLAKDAVMIVPNNVSRIMLNELLGTSLDELLIRLDLLNGLKVNKA